MRTWSWEHIVGPSADEYRILLDGTPQFHVYDPGTAQFIVDALNAAEYAEGQRSKPTEELEKGYCPMYKCSAPVKMAGLATGYGDMRTFRCENDHSLWSREIVMERHWP